MSTISGHICAVFADRNESKGIASARLQHSAKHHLTPPLFFIFQRLSAHSSGFQVRFPQRAPMYEGHCGVPYAE